MLVVPVEPALCLVEPARDFQVGDDDLPQPHERAHDAHAGLHGDGTAEYAREHDHAVLGECPRFVAATAVLQT